MEYFPDSISFAALLRRIVLINSDVDCLVIDFNFKNSVCSQIKMNFFAQNLREVSANLVKNFDTVFF